MRKIILFLGIVGISLLAIQATFACPACAEPAQPPQGCDDCYLHGGSAYPTVEIPYYYQHCARTNECDQYNTHNCCRHCCPEGIDYGCGNCCDNPCNQEPQYFIQAGAYRIFCHAVRQYERLRCHGICDLAIYRLCNGLYAVRSTKLYTHQAAVNKRDTIKREGFAAIVGRSQEW